MSLDLANQIFLDRRGGSGNHARYIVQDRTQCNFLYNVAMHIATIKFQITWGLAENMAMALQTPRSHTLYAHVPTSMCCDSSDLSLMELRSKLHDDT